MLLPGFLLLVTGMHFGKWFVGWQWLNLASVLVSGVRNDNGAGKSGDCGRLLVGVLGSGVRGDNDGAGKNVLLQPNNAR